MGVVNKYASSARDPSVTPPSLKPVQIRAGHMKCLVGTVEIANGDSATSTVEFGEIPSSALILASSLLERDALTGVTSFDLGLGKYDDASQAFVAGDVNCLVAASDIHTAGSGSAVSAVDIANRGKRAWEIAGYASDPGGNLTVMGTLNTDATAPGTITLTLVYATE